MANNPYTGGSMPPVYVGREKIFMDDIPITADNITALVMKAYQTHIQNVAEINHLYEYYLGEQIIHNKKKATRPEINNRIVANIAKEIADFKIDYLNGEGVQYASVSSDNIESVQILNRYMGIRDKDSLDTKLFFWMYICGVGVRIVTPERYPGYGERAPFNIYALDPRDAFVIYRNSLGEPPAIGVKFVKFEDGTKLFSCYTEDRYYEFTVPMGDGFQEITKSEPRYIRQIPIMEYVVDETRMGVYEPVLDLLDLYNTILSNRGDAIEQFVQSLLVLRNIQLDDDQRENVTRLGMIEYGDRSSDMPGEIKYLSAELDQDSTQTLQDTIYDTILRIVGMPNDRTHSTSSSDTGSAVILRSGWYEAEGRATRAEKSFKESEKYMLEYILNICRDTRTGYEPIDLQVSDIKIDIPRRPYENPQSKAQVLNTLLATIPPRQAYLYSNISSDIETDLAEYNAWLEEKRRLEEQQIKRTEENADTTTEVVNNETVLT